jgi:hypothetical protein
MKFQHVRKSSLASETLLSREGTAGLCEQLEQLYMRVELIIGLPMLSGTSWLSVRPAVQGTVRVSRL